MLQLLVAVTITTVVVMADPTVVPTTTIGTTAGTITKTQATHRDRIRDGAKFVVSMATVLAPVLSSNFMELEETQTNPRCLRMLHVNLVLTWHQRQHATPTTGS